MVLEEHPDAFFERFAQVAFETTILPSPYGYPLLELEIPGGLLPVFDQGPPPVETQTQRILVHGVAREYRNANEASYLHVFPGGHAKLSGFIQEALGDGFYHVASVIPVLVWVGAELEPGSRYVFDLAPPLLGYRP